MLAFLGSDLPDGAQDSLGSRPQSFSDASYFARWAFVWLLNYLRKRSMWSRLLGSNQRPELYESPALSTVLRRQKELVGMAGFEPALYGF